MKLKVLLFFCIALPILLVSCGPAKEKIDPLYEPEPIVLTNPKIEYWSNIAPNKIEPTGIQKFVRKAFGWIPVIGKLFQLPIELLWIILPPIEEIQSAQLPGGEWSDPKLMKIISKISLARGFIRVIPENERARLFPGYRPEAGCKGKNGNVGFKDFLNEVRVYILFKEPKIDPTLEEGEQRNPKVKEVLLARADPWFDENQDALDGQIKKLSFNLTEENLRPYLDYYGKFEVKIVINAEKAPDCSVYLDGKIKLEFDLNIAD